MAMTLVLISGGFDLSVGATLAFSGLVLVNLVYAGVPEIVAIGITLLVSFFHWDDHKWIIYWKTGTEFLCCDSGYDVLVSWDSLCLD